MSNIDLTGSEKQINWAKQIRGDFQSTESKSPDYPQHTEIGPLPRLLRLEASDPSSRDVINERRGYDAVLAQADASWWIENRNALTAASFKSSYKRLGKDLGVELIKRVKR